jgi:hypothetical protein
VWDAQKVNSLKEIINFTKENELLFLLHLLLQGSSKDFSFFSFANQMKKMKKMKQQPSVFKHVTVLGC